MPLQGYTLVCSCGILPQMQYHEARSISRERLVGFPKVLLFSFLVCLLASCSGKGIFRASAPRLDVIQCRLASDGEFVGVRLRVHGRKTFDPEALETYLLDESTGEKFHVVRLQRIGRLAEFPVPGEKDTHNILFRNRDGRLKVGTHVTLIVGSSRVKHLVIQD